MRLKSLQVGSKNWYSALTHGRCWGRTLVQEWTGDPNRGEMALLAILCIWETKDKTKAMLIIGRLFLIYFLVLGYLFIFKQYIC